MTNKPAILNPRFLIGLLLGAAVTLITIAVWLIANDEGSPIFFAVAGSMLATLTGVFATRHAKAKAVK